MSRGPWAHFENRCPIQSNPICYKGPGPGPARPWQHYPSSSSLLHTVFPTGPLTTGGLCAIQGLAHLPSLHLSPSTGLLCTQMTCTDPYFSCLRRAHQHLDGENERAPAHKVALSQESSHSSLGSRKLGQEPHHLTASRPALALHADAQPALQVSPGSHQPRATLARVPPSPSPGRPPAHQTPPSPRPLHPGATPTARSRAYRLEVALSDRRLAGDWLTQNSSFKAPANGKAAAPSSMQATPSAAMASDGHAFPAAKSRPGSASPPVPGARHL